MNSLFSLCSEDIDSAVELLESFYIQSTENQRASISFVFSKVLDANNDAVLDKCKTHTPPLHPYQWFSIRDARQTSNASKQTAQMLLLGGQHWGSLKGTFLFFIYPVKVHSISLLLL